MAEKEKKGQISMRPAQRVIDLLRTRARLAGRTQTALAERYLREGLMMDEHPGIHFEDHPRGRVARVTGFFKVTTIIEVFHANNSSVDETASYWEAEPRFIETALRYYADNREEIDDWIARKVEENEREYAKWRAAQELVAA